RNRRMTALTSTVTFAIGIVTAAYVVRVGGDFMHARMLLPATFLVLAPVWVVPWDSESGESRDARFLPIVAMSLLAVWARACILAFRVPEENQSGIGDERGWYTRLASARNPVRLEEYRSFYFYTEGEHLEQAARAACPRDQLPAGRSDASSCQP